MENPLSKLALDYWYKIFIVAGAFVFLLNGAGLLPAYPTKPTALIAAGIFFWGIGEWICHPLQTILTYDALGRPEGKITGYPRKIKTAGIAFDVAGIAMIVIGGILLF